MEKGEPLGYIHVPTYDEVGFTLPADNKNLLIKCVVTHDGRNDKVRYAIHRICMIKSYNQLPFEWIHFMTSRFWQNVFAHCSVLTLPIIIWSAFSITVMCLGIINSSIYSLCDIYQDDPIHNDFRVLESNELSKRLHC